MMDIPPLHVGRGTRRGPLTVFPTWHAAPAGRPVRLADEDTIDVRELRDPQVPHLRVTSTGPGLVLLLEGDVLVGGLQDRVSIASHLLIPGDVVVIDVRCGEPERWDGGDRQVAGTRRATAYVRGETDQQEVWRRVAVERGRVQRTPDVSDLRPLPGQSGVLIALGGRPALLEVFAEPDLLTQAWPRLMDAAAREAAGRPDKGATAHSARHFIGLVDQLMPHAVPGSSAGQAIQGSHGPLTLRGIGEGARVLHATVINHQEMAA
jgi:hypothetical protein